MVKKDVQISQDVNSIPFKNIRVSDMFGYIDYFYNEKTYKYPNGIIVLNGAYVYKEFRQFGKFKDFIKNILKETPQKTVIQIALKNKKLVPMFERMKFKRVKSIEYWGETSGSVLMQGILIQEMINSI